MDTINVFEMTRDEHNQPITPVPNKQQMINKLEAKVIYKLDTKQDFAVQLTMHFKCDYNVYQLYIMFICHHC